MTARGSLLWRGADDEDETTNSVGENLFLLMLAGERMMGDENSG